MILGTSVFFGALALTLVGIFVAVQAAHMRMKSGQEAFGREREFGLAEGRGEIRRRTMSDPSVQLVVERPRARQADKASAGIGLNTAEERHIPADIYTALASSDSPL